MAESLSPNHPQPQPRPTSPFFLGSNDDKLERAASRAARAAAFRRKPIQLHLSRNSLSSHSHPCLDRRQIMDLFHNCVKLASENKINQKNTWELNLIDHLSEIIKVEAENNNAQTNFQKASCTLETGVKIYALRVDACHADAYRVLNGISRAGLGDEQDVITVGDRTITQRDEGQIVMVKERKVSPLSTVESSFEVLNVKKFDVAFAVDPLYHQTSAQFDEGGAKGLLLSNLGVFGGCRVLFDSQEVPAKCRSSTCGSTDSDLVDVSFAKECVQLMFLHQKQDICPTLRDLCRQMVEYDLESIENGNTIDTNNVRFNTGNNCCSMRDATEDIEAHTNDGSCDDTETDHYHDTTVFGEGVDTNILTMQNLNEEPGQFVHNKAGVADNFEDVTLLFCRGLGYKSASNSWAGPDHLKYLKPNVPTCISAHASKPNCAAKKPKRKSEFVSDIDFTSNLDVEAPEIGVPVKNPESLLLPPSRVSCANKLPEDCHYQPEDLVKLFLLPNIMCLGKKRSMSDPNSRQQIDDADGTFSSWEKESTVNGPFDNVYEYRNIEEEILIPEPHKVDKIEVDYVKTSNHVDLHMLKATLWTLLQESIQKLEVKAYADPLSFRHVLTAFPDDCKAVASPDISPHLCFICLLHLANEHGLTIEGCPNLDDLIIHFPVPVPCEDTWEVIQASAYSKSV